MLSSKLAPQSTRRSRFIWFLRGLSESHGHLVLPAAAAILTLCSTWIIVGPVLNRSGDNMYHLLNQWALLNGINAGDNIFGPLGMEFGQPVLRFYQALFYLHNIAWRLITGVDIRTIHNLTIVASFALSPFAYTYFLRKLGLNRWTAGFGGMLSMVSIAAFGHSFEAYHQAGIVTQSMGGLFFPWFMGNFIGMMRGENRPVTTGMLFALAFLSHAIMSVFAVFAGVLYFLVSEVSVKKTWLRIAAFGLVGSALVAFWVFPFLAHTAEMRPVPDSIVRGKGVHWFTSVSRSELSMVLFSGRLLDDASARRDDRDANDKFMDKISIIGTLKTRPRVLTSLALLGVLCAMVGFRRTSRRFLLGGFAFSLMLFAGPDDYRWLHYLPFMKQIQTFRCTYLIEFFAFGLAAIFVEAVIKHTYKFAKTRRWRLFRYPLLGVSVLLVGTIIGWTGQEIIMLGQAHLRVRNPKDLNRMVDATSSLPDQGYPFRVTPKTGGRTKLHHGWYAAYGFQPYCTHWKGTGPTSAYHLCSNIGGPKRNGAYHALAGIRYYSGNGDKIDPISKVMDKDKTPVLDRLPNGPDRNKRGNRKHKLLDNGHDHFLRPFLGKPLPVVCSHKQWIWITKSWMQRYRSKLWNESAPITMRVRDDGLAKSGLLSDSGTIFYLDHTNLEKDKPALLEFVSRGGVVVSPLAIPGVLTTLTEDKKFWPLLDTVPPKAAKAARGNIQREDLDPGLEVTEITMLKPKLHTYQKFAFDVDAMKPVTLVLPMENVPGWQATLDGAPIPVFSTGPDLVGVRLAKGAHRLVFEWKMLPWHLVTLVISILALLMVIGVWIKAAYNFLKKV